MSNRSCCVVNCKNTSNNNDCKFYKFPVAKWKISQRNKWIAAVRRKNADGSPWCPKPHDYICSDHFIGGKKAEEELSPSYVPTIFPSVYNTPNVNESSALSSTRQIKTPAQRSREYRKRQKNQVDSQQRMPQKSSTKRVREFRERQRQKQGLRPRGGYRQNAGRPRGNRTAADRIRDYRQRQQENRARDFQSNHLTTKNVMNDTDCDMNKQKNNKIDTEHYLEEKVKNDRIVCKTNYFEEVMIKEEVFDDFEDENNSSQIESKTSNFEEVKIKDHNEDIEDRNKDIDERLACKSKDLEEIQIKEEFHNNDYVDYLQYQNYLYSSCKIKPENKDEEATAL